MMTRDAPIRFLWPISDIQFYVKLPPTNVNVTQFQFLFKTSFIIFEIFCAFSTAKQDKISKRKQTCWLQDLKDQPQKPQK